MLGFEPDIEADYLRTINGVDGVDDRLAPECLTLGEVLKAHYLIANHFYLEGHGLGGIGPRDTRLLQSAVYRQQVTFEGRMKWTDRLDICATLFYGLIMNHPFYDANKRTAFLTALYQLHRFNRCPSVSEKEFEDFTVEIADNALTRYPRYRDLVKARDPDPEVRFISHYLKRNTRQIDKTHHSITYRQLQTILARYDLALANPSGNFIDVVRHEKKRPFLGVFGAEKSVEIRVARVGFPRWTAEVGKGALKTIRDAAGLVADKGVDSASFYNGLDPMQTLITTYHEPLMRLAER